MRMSLPSDSFDFDLSIQFRGDKDKWAWNVSGICNDFGPGMICGVILDGCEPSGDGKHFYITYNKNRTSLYLYPKQIPIEIVSDKLGDNKTRILTEGKDDKIFRLDKTACWKAPPAPPGPAWSPNPAALVKDSLAGALLRHRSPGE
jgi:hypothetical protein